MAKKITSPWACVERVIISCDVIIEVLDARFPEETRSPEFEQLVRNKRKDLIILLNKADLVNKSSRENIRASIDYHPTLLFSAKARWAREKARFFRTIITLVKKPLGRDGRIRVGFVGFPNTGKSSIINFLAHRHVARTSTVSGFTRGVQWISPAGRWKGTVLFMDTPGAIPLKNRIPELEGELLMTGALSPDKTRDPIFAAETILAKFLEKGHTGRLSLFTHYGLDDVPENVSAHTVLELVGRRRGRLCKGGTVDFKETAKIVLRDWQSGKIRIG